MSTSPDHAAEPMEASPQDYDLFVRPGSGFVLRLRDEGVRLEADTLSYMQDGEWYSRPYRDITEVHISSGNLPGYGLIGQCRISFDGDDMALLVTSAGGNGFPDPKRSGEYTTFLRDFHGRLAAAGETGHISFRSGFSSARQAILIIAMVAGAVLFIALPLVLLIVTSEASMLATMLFGVFFLWPAWRVAQSNRPGTYDPRHPPDMLS